MDAFLAASAILLPLAYLASAIAYGTFFFSRQALAERLASPLLALALGLHLAYLTLLTVRFEQFPATTVSQGAGRRRSGRSGVRRESPPRRVGSTAEASPRSSSRQRVRVSGSSIPRWATRSHQKKAPSSGAPETTKEVAGTPEARSRGSASS